MSPPARQPGGFAEWNRRRWLGSGAAVVGGRLVTVGFAGPPQAFEGPVVLVGTPAP